MRVTLLATTNSRSYTKINKQLGDYLGAVLVANEESILDFDHANHFVNLVLVAFEVFFLKLKLAARLCYLHVRLAILVIPGAKCGALIVVHVLLLGVRAGPPHLLLVLEV